eukprot:m.112553 g.112553  ORF g.112553 m.112553 type:complete len:617 (+) comp15413_c0_seq1:160-2010(+)
MADADRVALLEPSMTDFIKLSLNFSGDEQALTCQAVAKGRELRFVGLERAPKRSMARRLGEGTYVLKVASVWEEAPSWGVALTVRDTDHELHSFYLEVTRESTQLEWLRYVEAAVRYRQLKSAFVSPSKIIISELVGQGAYGSVYRGDFDGTVVAVKRLKLFEEDPVAKIEAINEAVILHQLRHPCLTQFHGLTAEQSTDCTLVDMVIEFCPQGTLGAYLKGPIRGLDLESSQAMLVNTAYQIFSGLAYLHSQDIIHRDLKPDNCLLTADFSVKICDLGQARVIGSTAARSKMTANARGTLLWRAPEMSSTPDARGKYSRSAHYSTPVDVYSAAIIVWQLHTHQEPYADIPSLFEIETGVQDGNLRPLLPPETPVRLEQLISQAWDGNPRARPSAAECAVRVASDKLLEPEPPLDDETSELRRHIEQNERSFAQLKLDAQQRRSTWQRASIRPSSRTGMPFDGRELSPVTIADDSESKQQLLRAVAGRAQERITLTPEGSSNAVLSLSEDDLHDLPLLGYLLRNPTFGIITRRKSVFGGGECFRGSDLVKWVQQLFATLSLSNERVVAVCKQLHAVQFFHHSISSLGFSKTCFFYFYQGDYHDVLVACERKRIYAV